MDILLDFIGFSRINGAIRWIVSAQSGNPLSVRDVKGLRDRLILPSRAKFSTASHGVVHGEQLCSQCTAAWLMLYLHSKCNVYKLEQST